MNITRRRGAIALAITLGVLIVGGLIAFNIAWIILNEEGPNRTCLMWGHHLSPPPDR